MAAGGKIIGRLSIKVTPDTDGFWEQVRRELKQVPDEITVEVNPDVDGLRQKVSAATKAAEAGQKIEVPVDVDKNKVGQAVRDAASSARPATANVTVDKGQITDSIRDATRGQSELDLTLDSKEFQRRIDGLLKPIEIPVALDDAGKSVDNELRTIREYGALEIPVDLDTTGFSKQALDARAEALKVLDRNRTALSLEADDKDLQNKLATARAQMKELQELGVSPKFDSTALQGFQRDLAKAVTNLDKLRQRQSGITELELFDRQKLEIDLEWLQGKIDDHARKLQAIQAGSGADSSQFKDATKQLTDMVSQASKLQRRIDDINSRPLDPKINDSVAREIANVDKLEGKIRDMRAMGSAQQYNEDLDKALATVRKIENSLAKNSSARAKIGAEIDEQALDRALNVLRSRTSEAVEDAHFRVNLDYGDMDRQLRDAVQRGRPNVRPELDPNTQSDLSRALQGMDLRVPADIDTSRFSQQALDMRTVAQQILDDARLLVRLDADDRELNRKTAEARDRLQTLSDMRVDPEFGTRGLDRVNELIVKTQRDLERLNSQRVGPQLDPALERQIESATNRLRTLQDVGSNMSREGVKYRVESDIDSALAGFRRLDSEADRITKKRRTINYDVDTDKVGAAMRVLSSTTDAAAKAASMGMGVAKTAMEGLGTATTDVGKQVMDLANRMQAFQTVQQWAMGLATIFAQLLVVLPAIGTAVALVGAAISALFATVVTAAASLIPMLGLIGAGAGVVAMGIVGIRKAAATLLPEFEALQRVASETFEATMTPQLERLSPILTNLKQPVHELAQVIGQDLTQSVVDAIVVFDEMTGIEDTIGQITSALLDMAPGVYNITRAILEMVAVEEGVRILTNAVNELGDGWNSAVQEMKMDGSLQAAFQGLDGVVQALMRSLTSLVENGLRMFAAAAPGIQATVDAITGFFDRFDYAALGSAVGAVFDGIATAINNIPQSTIDQLTDAFVRMGAAFQSTNFQAGADALIQLATVIITYLPQTIEVFGAVAQAFTGFVQTMMGLAPALGGVWKIIRGDLGGGLTDIANVLMEGGPQLEAGAANLGDSLVRGMNLAQGNFESSIAGFSNTANSLTEAITGPLTGAGSAVQGAMDRLAEITGTPPPDPASTAQPWAFLGQGIGQAPATGIQTGIAPTQGAAGLLSQATQPPGGDLTPPWAAGVAPIPGVVSDGLSPVPAAATGIIEEIGPSVDAAFANLGTNVENGVTGWAERIRSGLSNTRNQIMEQFDLLILDVGTKTVGIGDAIGENAKTWSLTVDAAMLALRDNVNNGFIAVQDGVTTSMTGISDAIGNGALGWDTDITTAMTNIQDNVTNGFTGISDSVTSNMSTIEAAIAQGSDNWALSVDISSRAMADNLRNAMTGMSTNARDQMTAISDAIATATLGWGDSVRNATTGMSNAIQTAFAGIVSTVQTQMNSVTTTIQNSTQSWDEAVRNAGTGMSDAMRDSMTQITDAVRDGMQQATDAVRTAMDDMVNAVVDGGNRLVDEVTSACDRAVDAAEAVVPRFRTAGENMGQALADGLNSKAGAVEAAASRLADAAAAATEAAAQINSPSRVFTKLGEFIGIGFANGISHSAKYAEAQGAKMVGLVVDTADQVKDAFEGTQLGKEFVSDLRSEIPRTVKSIKSLASGEMRHSVESDGFGSMEDRVADALSGWAIQIDANGMARMVNKANTRKARR